MTDPSGRFAIPELEQGRDSHPPEPTRPAEGFVICCTNVKVGDAPTTRDASSLFDLHLETVLDQLTINSNPWIFLATDCLKSEKTAVSV